MSPRGRDARGRQSIHERRPFSSLRFFARKAQVLTVQPGQGLLAQAALNATFPARPCSSLLKTYTTSLYPLHHHLLLSLPLSLFLSSRFLLLSVILSPVSLLGTRANRVRQLCGPGGTDRLQLATSCPLAALLGV